MSAKACQSSRDYFAGNRMNDMYTQPKMMFGTIDAVYYLPAKSRARMFTTIRCLVSCNYDRVAYIPILHTIGVAFTAISLIGSHYDWCQHQRTKKREFVFLPPGGATGTLANIARTLLGINFPGLAKLSKHSSSLRKQS